MRKRVLITMVLAIMFLITGINAEARPHGHKHGRHKMAHRYMQPPPHAYRPYLVVAPPRVHYRRVWVPGYWRPAYRGNVWIPGYWTRRGC